MAGSGVLVANPGGVSWMIESAAAFARSGELVEYCSPAIVGQDDLQKLRQRLPGAVGDRVVSELRRRATPPEVGGHIRRVGTLAEIAYVLTWRMPVPLAGRLLAARGRMVAFDQATSRRLRRGMGAVIGYQGAAARTFDAARRLGVATVLDYPIAHYEVTEALLNEERRLVPSYADTLPPPYEPWRRRRYAQEIANADRVIMLSSYHQRTFEQVGVNPSKLFTAPLCVDLELFTPPMEEPERPFRVAFCGQITQRKGLSYLVEGFKRAELRDAELLFIGAPFGSADAWIREPRLRHVPAMPRHRLPEVLQTCHVVALPSLIEGFGATALEGMACGLPAIVSEHTFSYDVVSEGQDGFVIPIRDPDAIADRLRRLYDDPSLRRRMGTAARHKAEQFPWSRYREALRAGIAPLLAAPDDLTA